MTIPPSQSDFKNFRIQLRRVTISGREALTETARSALTARLEQHLVALLEALNPSSIGFCWPYRAEPDLRRFITHWLAAAPNRLAALPVVLDREKPMVFRQWTPETRLVPDRHGIPHPPCGEPVVPDAVLVPVNAFDADGYRIGYGGGYFDRTLAVMDTIAIGVGFELGRVLSVYPQPYDRPMNWIVTEAGTLRVPPK